MFWGKKKPWLGCCGPKREISVPKFELRFCPCHWGGPFCLKLCEPSRYIIWSWFASKKSHSRTFAQMTPSEKVHPFTIILTCSWSIAPCNYTCHIPIFAQIRNLLSHDHTQFFPSTRYLDYAVRVEETTLQKSANLVWCGRSARTLIALTWQNKGGNERADLVIYEREDVAPWGLFRNHSNHHDSKHSLHQFKSKCLYASKVI